MIAQKSYELFKEDALRKQPIRKRVQLSELKIISLDSIEYAGILLGIRRSALKDLISLIGFSVKGQTLLQNNTGEEASIKILNSLKNLIARAKNEVEITVTPDRIITQIRNNKDSSSISANAFFETAERLINVHDLDLTGMNFNESNGNINIQTISPNGDFQVGNFDEEQFKAGINISKSQGGIQANPYLNRLICSNGMVTTQFEEGFSLKSTDTKEWEQFYIHMTSLQKNGWAPAKFSQKVLEAKETAASYAELERGTHLILGSSNCKEDDLEMFFKGRKRTNIEFARNGIDLDKLNPKQKQNLRTSLSVWDVINGITDFASHNYGYEKKKNSDGHLQVSAGYMLCKELDSGNIISNQPF